MHSRRLLDTNALAEKMGCSRHTFEKYRPKLELAGFPLPALDNDEFGGRRWDEKAIDAWLDSRMPAHLKVAGAQAYRDHIPDTASVAARLQERARSMVLS